ncbi:hypothetical protein PFISCL1PPCAC_17875, partial [Pristionchus fissidentatus]
NFWFFNPITTPTSGGVTFADSMTCTDGQWTLEYGFGPNSETKVLTAFGTDTLRICCSKEAPPTTPSTPSCPPLGIITPAELAAKPIAATDVYGVATVTITQSTGSAVCPPGFTNFWFFNPITTPTSGGVTFADSMTCTDGQWTLEYGFGPNSETKVLTAFGTDTLRICCSKEAPPTTPSTPSCPPLGIITPAELAAKPIAATDVYGVATVTIAQSTGSAVCPPGFTNFWFFNPITTPNSGGVTIADSMACTNGQWKLEYGFGTPQNVLAAFSTDTLRICCSKEAPPTTPSTPTCPPLGVITSSEFADFHKTAGKTTAEATVTGVGTGTATATCGGATDTFWFFNPINTTNSGGITFSGEMRCTNGQWILDFYFGYPPTQNVLDTYGVNTLRIGCTSS